MMPNASDILYIYFILELVLWILSLILICKIKQHVYKSFFFYIYISFEGR